jgi:hypothetical protein
MDDIFHFNKKVDENNNISFDIQLKKNFKFDDISKELMKSANKKDKDVVNSSISHVLNLLQTYSFPNNYTKGSDAVVDKLMEKRKRILENDDYINGTNFIKLKNFIVPNFWPDDLPQPKVIKTNKRSTKKETKELKKEKIDTALALLSFFNDEKNFKRSTSNTINDLIDRRNYIVNNPDIFNKIKGFNDVKNFKSNFWDNDKYIEKE